MWYINPADGEKYVAIPLKQGLIFNDPNTPNSPVMHRRNPFEAGTNFQCKTKI